MATPRALPPDRPEVDRASGAAAGGDRAEPAGERSISVDGAVEDEAIPQATRAQEATEQATDKHEQFCNKVGLQRAEGAASSVTGITVPCLDPVEHGYYYEINRAYEYHSLQYWFIASLINTLHLSQIIIGATATALGGAGVSNRASTKRTTAITVLTTIMTVIAAILVYFKSRGQPNRVRQLRNDLRKVRDYVKFMEIEFRHPPSGPSVDDALNKIRGALYQTHRESRHLSVQELILWGRWAWGLEQERKAPLLWTYRFWEGILDASFILHYFVAPEVPVRRKMINKVMRDFNAERPFSGNVLCRVCKVLHHWHLEHGHQADCLCSDREALPAINE